MVYYYKTPTGLPLDELNTKLRALLSEVTSYFPVITGRLMKNEEGKWMIKCNDAGVRIIEAIAKGSVETWLENVNEEKEKKLIHWEDWYHIPYYWATFYIMITSFEEGGIAIGVSCSHLLADSSSAALLIKAWADKALYGNVSIPPFVHSLPTKTLGIQKAHHQPNNHLINHYRSLLESPSPCSISSMIQKSKTVIISFTDHVVHSCMNLAQLNGPSYGLDPSPFPTLAAVLWLSISKVKGEINGLVDMSISLDMRKVLGLDQGFFGNCMIYTKVNSDKIGVDDLQAAAKVIGDEIDKVNKERVQDLIEWLQHCNNFSPPTSFNKGNLIFYNLENVNLYSAVFLEEYDPIKIAIYHESDIVDNGKVLVLPSHPSEGKLSRTVMVTLPNSEALKLCQDEFLASFSPAILMGI
ncbi:Shikimate O-hydroxycinnamoyltransferase [Bienertia sinuspersici]